MCFFSFEDLGLDLASFKLVLKIIISIFFNVHGEIMIIKVAHTNSLLENAGLKADYKGIIKTYFLMRSHPRKMIFDLTGAIWSVYFLWNQNWQYALTSFLVMGILGLFFTRNIDSDLMAQTTIGRIGLLHAHPINLTLNLIGLFFLIYGIWMHEEKSILIGVSTIIMGHFFGWTQVNSKLKV